MPNTNPGSARPRKGARPAPQPRRKALDEGKVHGVNACDAVWRIRPDDIIRVYLNRARMAQFSELLAWCAEKRIAYHIVRNDELAKISASQHHEGICMLVRRAAPLSFEALCSRVAARTGPVCLLLLDKVSNPHNLGAILRVAAHFGVAGILSSHPEEKATLLSPAVQRTAEGAAEYVPLVPVRDPVTAVRRLRRCALDVVATSSHAATPIDTVKLPARCLFLLGSEAKGLRQELRQEALETVLLRGTGWVESLNVACATAALLTEYRGRHPLP